MDRSPVGRGDARILRVRTDASGLVAGTVSRSPVRRHPRQLREELAGADVLDRAAIRLRRWNRVVDRLPTLRTRSVVAAALRLHLSESISSTATTPCRYRHTRVSHRRRLAARFTGRGAYISTSNHEGPDTLAPRPHSANGGAAAAASSSITKPSATAPPGVSSQAPEARPPGRPRLTWNPAAEAPAATGSGDGSSPVRTPAGEDSAPTPITAPECLCGRRAVR